MIRLCWLPAGTMASSRCELSQSLSYGRYVLVQMLTQHSWMDKARAKTTRESARSGFRGFES